MWHCTAGRCFPSSDRQEPSHVAVRTALSHCVRRRLAFALAAAVWLQTRQRHALGAVLVTLGLTGVGLLVERLVVTDAEQVRTTLRWIAERIEQNDLPAVLRAISETAPALRQEATDVLSQVDVEEISIKRNLRVQVVRRANRTTAEARFNAVATASDRQGTFGTQVIPRFLVVRFLWEHDAWKVIDYQVFDPRDGLRQTPRPVSGN